MSIAYGRNSDLLLGEMEDGQTRLVVAVARPSRSRDPSQLKERGELHRKAVCRESAPHRDATSKAGVSCRGTRSPRATSRVGIAADYYALEDLLFEAKLKPCRLYRSAEYRISLPSRQTDSAKHKTNKLTYDAVFPPQNKA